MGKYDAEVQNRNKTLLSSIQKWVEARFLALTKIVYYSKGAESSNTIPALNRYGKLDNTFLNTGSTGGIDADLLDGQDSTYFLAASAYNGTDILNKLVVVDGAGSALDADLLDGYEGSHYLPASSYTAADVLAKLLTVDGHLSGLDADLFDGMPSSSFADTAHTHDYVALNTLTGNTGYIATVGDFITNNGAAPYIKMGDSYGIRYVPAATGGFARAFGLMQNNGTTVLAEIGFYGANNALNYAYVGSAYNVTWQKWTAELSELSTPLNIGGALTFASTLLNINHGTNTVLRNHTAGESYLKLGIGQTANAAQALHFYAAADGVLSAFMQRAAGTNGVLEWRQYGTGNFLLRTVDAAAIVFNTGDTVRMTISATGLVGIGVTPATQKLKVLGSVAVGGDDGGTASYTTLTNVTVAVSTGTVTVKSRTASNVNTTGFLKVYVGTAAKYLPYTD